jgi:hypothetical protein
MMLRRASSRLLAVGLALGIVALAATLYLGRLRRNFSGPTEFATGTVLRSGAFLPNRRSRPEDMFCWVEYQFAPRGGTPQSGRRMWNLACHIKRGTTIPIQYVVGRPELNRPQDAEPPVSPFLLWLAAGTVTVIGVLRRSDAADAIDEEGQTGLRY